MKISSRHSDQATRRRWWAPALAAALLTVLTSTSLAIPIKLNQLGTMESDQAVALDGRPGAVEFSGINQQLAAGDYAGVAQRARTQLEKDSNQALAHEILGTALFYQGDAAGAAAAWQQAITLDPEQAGPQLKLGILRMEQGELATAEQLMLESLRLNPDSLRAHERLGLLYEYQRRYQEAIAQFNQVLEEADPAYLGIAINQAALLNRERRYSDTLTMLQPRAKLNPTDASALVMLGQAHLGLGDRSAGEAAFTEAARLGYPQLELDKRLAQAHLDRKEFDQAQAIYQRLIRDKTADAYVFGQSAELLINTGEQARGEQLLQTAMQQMPDSAYLQLRYGSYLASLRRYADSLPFFQRACELAPESGRYWHLYSVALSRAGDKQAAADAAGKFHSLEPRNLDAALLYAASSFSAGDVSRAEGLYREILAVAPQHPLSLNNLANILAEKNELAEAEQLARRAVAAVGDNAALRDTLGWILYQQGKLKQANEELDSAAKLAPETAVVWYHLGVVLDAMKQNQQAQAALTRALALDDQQSWADDARSKASSSPPQQ